MKNELASYSLLSLLITFIIWHKPSGFFILILRHWIQQQERKWFPYSKWPPSKSLISVTLSLPRYSIFYSCLAMEWLKSKIECVQRELDITRGSRLEARGKTQALHMVYVDRERVSVSARSEPLDSYPFSFQMKSWVYTVGLQGGSAQVHKISTSQRSHFHEFIKSLLPFGRREVIYTD